LYFFILESTFGELVDLLNSKRVCPLEVVWILEDINLTCEGFNSFSFVSVPLKCNRAALALAMLPKRKEKPILGLKNAHLFSS